MSKYIGQDKNGHLDPAKKLIVNDSTGTKYGTTNRVLMIIRAEARKQIKDKNSIALTKIIEDSKNAILSQAGGCYIPEYGVDYFNPITKTRDSIGLLVPFYSNGKLRRHYGLINQESQKPIVRIIQKTYEINVSRNTEYDRFVQILQELQCAHDAAFDSGRNDINLFVDLCNKLIKEIYVRT